MCEFERNATEIITLLTQVALEKLDLFSHATAYKIVCISQLEMVFFSTLMSLSDYLLVLEEFLRRCLYLLSVQTQTTDLYYHLYLFHRKDVYGNFDR